MGAGLGIQPSGTHIAVTAGTGVLVFVDLVAHLIRKNLGLLSHTENMMINDNSEWGETVGSGEFKFVFYVSFRKKEEAVALDLLLGL